MTAALRIPELDLARVRRFCQTRIPEHARGEMRLEADVRGCSVKLVECRPLWSDPSAEWTRMNIAQLRYDESGPTWTLYWADRNQRWHRYWDLEPAATIGTLLDEIDEDPTGIFFG